MFKKLILCAALSLAAADDVDTRVAINCGENSDNFKIVGQFAEPLEGIAEASLTASPGGSVVVKRASIDGQRWRGRFLIAWYRYH